MDEKSNKTQLEEFVETQVNISSSRGIFPKYPSMVIKEVVKYIKKFPLPILDGIKENVNNVSLPSPLCPSLKCYCIIVFKLSRVIMFMFCNYNSTVLV